MPPVEPQHAPDINPRHFSPQAGSKLEALTQPENWKKLTPEVRQHLAIALTQVSPALTLLGSEVHGLCGGPSQLANLSPEVRKELESLVSKDARSLTDDQLSKKLMDAARNPEQLKLIAEILVNDPKISAEIRGRLAKALEHLDQALEWVEFAYNFIDPRPIPQVPLPTTDRRDRTTLQAQFSTILPPEDRPWMASPIEFDTIVRNVNGVAAVVEELAEAKVEEFLQEKLRVNTQKQADIRRDLFLKSNDAIKYYELNAELMSLLLEEDSLSDALEAYRAEDLT